MIKRAVVFALVAVSLISVPSYALDTALIDMRNKIFAESNTLKPLLKDSKDTVLISSMWDSCLIATMQLDAYFSMIGIFNTIKELDLDAEVFTYLANWLNVIKENDRLNIKVLDSITEISDLRTKVSLQRLRGYFEELNVRIDAELTKLSMLKETLKR